MWNFFKVFIEFVAVLLLLYVLVFWPGDMWDLSSPPRDQTHTSTLEGQVPSTGLLGKYGTTIFVGFVCLLHFSMCFVCSWCCSTVYGILALQKETESEVAWSCPTLCSPMDCTCQAPPSMGFSRQGYWSGLPFPSPGDLPNPGSEPGSPAVQADSLPSEPQGGFKDQTLTPLHWKHEVLTTELPGKFMGFFLGGGGVGGDGHTM